MIFRTVHQDRGFRLTDASLDPYPERDRNEARRSDRDGSRANPSAIVHRLRRDLGCPRMMPFAALRDVAFEVIREQPGYFVLSTARLTAALFAGRYEGST